jgi:hypothetical protein
MSLNLLPPEKVYFRFIPASFGVLEEINTSYLEQPCKERIAILERRGYISELSIKPITLGFLITFDDIIPKSINEPNNFLWIEYLYIGRYRMYTKFEFLIDNILFKGHLITEKEYNSFLKL